MANALESASLVMIPSGYEDGTLGSLKPTDGTGDFTFSRGSNLSATRINEQGYIEKGYENLFLQSNSFTTTWSQANILPPTSGQTGYDGSSDAWYFEKVGAFGRLQQSISTSGVQTLSVYLKAKDSSWVNLETGGANTSRQYFDLTAPIETAKGFSNNIISSSIEDAGDGWRKCSITYEGTKTFAFVFIAEGNGQINGTTGSLYIQDAMLNQGLVAYPYIETTTAPVAGGILEDMPRLDWSGSCPSLLLEPSRTNSFNYSEALYQLPVKSGVSWEDNVTTSPEGLQNAGKITEGTGFQYLGQSSLQGANRVISVFAKYDNSLTRIALGQYITTNQVANAVFNIQTGTILSETTGSSNVMILEDAGVEDYGNGWRRYWVSVSGSNGVAYVAPSNSDTISFVPNYTGSGQHCFLYGLQYEQDATYPTSYIPTYGVSQTRLGDVCGGAGDAETFNDNEGVLYAEISVLANDGTFRNISVSNGTFSQAIRIYYRNNDDEITIFLNSDSGGSTTISIPSATDYIKLVVKYDTDTIKIFINGVLEDTLSSLIMPTGLQQLDFSRAGSLPFYGNTKQLLYFPTALSDSECIALTTI